MRAIILPLLALTVTAPALAATDPVRVVRDGATEIRYTVSREADGTLVMRGAQANGVRPFTLKLSRGWVNGEVNGQRVSFRAPASSAALASTN